MLMIHNWRRFKEYDYDRRDKRRRLSAMTTRFRPPWYLRCWLSMCPRARLHISSPQLTNSITVVLFFVVFLISIALVQLLTRPTTSPSVRSKYEYIPMVQFDRGDVSRSQVLENARHALQKVAEFKRSLDKPVDPRTMFASLLQTMDKKEKRQFLALEAFNIFDIEDFESLMELGYEMNEKSDDADFPPLDYKNSHKMVEHVTPKYQKLCYNTSFTLSNIKRPMDENFCDRLKFLDSEMKAGRDVPLLTIYTWWPDPLTDSEVLSKRAVLANWDLFRPFITPVVFTNFRMNMAVANAHGWPCLPVEFENEAGRPIFKHTAAAMETTLKSTFYGYARANTMFDSSLLLTLLGIKDRYVRNSFPSQKVNSAASENEYYDQQETDTPPETPLFIYGMPIRTSAVGLETFEKMEYFHKHVENAIRKNETNAISLKPNYVIYRGVDFSDDAAVVIDDDLLIPYLLKRRMRYKNIVIDSSETILSSKTHRHLDVNDWGRKYIRTKPPDRDCNKRHLNQLKRDIMDSDESRKAKFMMTLYGDKNRVRVMAMTPPEE